MSVLTRCLFQFTILWKGGRKDLILYIAGVWKWNFISVEKNGFYEK